MSYSFKFYEFFCGGGMARAGLGSNWECLFANDIDFKKANSYSINWSSGALKVADIVKITTKDLPGRADLAWASFPCQDLSLAGMGAGLKGDRSGTFWPFWKNIKTLKQEGRAPKFIVLENVCGALTSHNGKDFSAICEALRNEDYLFGALVIDASNFIPQSRPRLFIIGLQKNITDIGSITQNAPNKIWHTDALIKAYSNLDSRTKSSWVWWKLPSPQVRKVALVDLIEENPKTVSWHSQEETQRLLDLMSPINLAKVHKAQKEKAWAVGTIYKRTRVDADGNKKQRAEIRFDDIAGCLRTPTGGSSRQIIMTIKGNDIRSRLLSTREAARLMGLPEQYILPKNYNDAYHLLGDGVVVPVVSFITQNLLEPILSNLEKVEKAA